MNEYDLIKKLFKKVPNLFESDASIINIGNEKWGMTCDQFSLTEDLFTDDTPYILGHNLVVATISDLIASGCQPIFFQQALILPASYPPEWVETLNNGIQDTLEQYNTLLIGGDLGQATEFSYTGIGLGKQVRNISRIFPPQEQELYVSGKLGDANSAVLYHKSTPEFEIRVLPKTALSCIDTSGGFVDAVWQLHQLNPNFKIEINNPPVDDLALLFGGAGEYELLFTGNDIQENNAICIGRVIPHQKGVFLDEVEITQAPPDARSYKNIDTYITAVKRMVNGYLK